MFEIELEAYDYHQIVYKLKGLSIVGNRIDKDTFLFYFPEYDPVLAMDKKVDYYPVFKEEIPMYGEDLHKWVKGSGKSEIEEIINKELLKEDNRQLLILLVLNSQDYYQE